VKPAEPASGETAVLPSRSLPPASAAGPRADYEYVEAWGMAHGGLARVLRPRSVEEVRAAHELARREGVPLAHRGTGCSYGDASTSRRGHVLDLTRMDRVLAWDPQTGLAELEAGVTIEQLWKRILPDGWWPKVVSGTMFPTVGGTASMNIHGKNNYAVGTFGDNTLELDLALPSGELRTCNRERDAELFHAAIGGFGMLGTITRVLVRTKKIHSGELEVRGVSTRNLREMMDYFEEHKARADYLVGWVDCFARDESFGRGLIHDGRYLEPGRDPAPERTLRVAYQELPERILGLFPKDQVWRALRLFNRDAGMRLMNAVKYQAGRLEGMKGPYRQPHAAFNFLLDYVPNWKWAYGRRPGHGLIQHQLFLPDAVAHDVLREVFQRSQDEDLVSYLGVFKRHRPDPFWLTHALDGWSMALDFKVTPANRERLWRHCHWITDLALESGGRHYFAKDLVLRPEDARRMFPAERLEAFRRLKNELDPEGLFQTDLSRRLFDDWV
jgi:FAD/FMN-containing dehydrogenase